MSTEIVLVPGFWLGAWAWDDVAPLLVERGFDVSAISLPGLDSLDAAGVGLAEQADAISAALDPAADRRVLVVHSGAAFPATMVIDRQPGLVDRLVLVHTAIPVDGIAFNPEQDGDSTLAEAWDGLEQEGSFRDLTDDQLATFKQRALPQPHDVVTEPISLTNPERSMVPVTAICTVFDAAAYQDYAKQGVPFLAGLLEHQVDYIDLPTGHWPMWSKPAELAELIAAAAAT